MGKPGALLTVLGLALAFVDLVAGGNFYKECDATWNPQNCWASDNGNAVSLALVSNTSGTLSFSFFLDFNAGILVSRFQD
jgi:xyloglucan:xyloglucosyl transferase